jgi:hypothetical protein
LCPWACPSETSTGDSARSGTSGERDEIQAYPAKTWLRSREQPTEIAEPLGRDRRNSLRRSHGRWGKWGQHAGEVEQIIQEDRATNGRSGGNSEKLGRTIGGEGADNRRRGGGQSEERGDHHRSAQVFAGDCGRWIPRSIQIGSLESKTNLRFEEG